MESEGAFGYLRLEDRHLCLSRTMGILPVDNQECDKLEACRSSEAGSLTSKHRRALLILCSRGERCATPSTKIRLEGFL